MVCLFLQTRIRNFEFERWQHGDVLAVRKRSRPMPERRCSLYDRCRSDGMQPHYVNIEFVQKTPVEVRLHTKGRMALDFSYFSQRISMFVDYEKDESYAPSKVAVYAGSHFHDLVVSVTVCLHNVVTSRNVFRIMATSPQQVSLRDLQEPVGWVNISLRGAQDR